MQWSQLVDHGMGQIFSTLFSVFNTTRLMSIPTPLTGEWCDNFLAEHIIKVYILFISLCLTSVGIVAPEGINSALLKALGIKIVFLNKSSELIHF